MQKLNPDQLVDLYLREARLRRVIDGDTLDLYIEQGFTQGFKENVRLYGVNTPEERSTEAPAGKWVTKQVEKWFEGVDSFWLHSIEYHRDRYGRVVAYIYKKDGECLNEWLIVNGYGWITDEHGSIIGNRDIQRLKIPQGLKDQVLINQRG